MSLDESGDQLLLSLQWCGCALPGYLGRNGVHGVDAVGTTVDCLAWPLLWASNAALNSSPSAWSLAVNYFHNTFKLCFVF